MDLGKRVERGESMKAAVLREPGKLVVETVPEQELGAYGVLCKILYGTLCSGTDTHIVDGIFPFTQALPTIPGHESIGQVVSVGPNVRHFSVGDLVTRVGYCPPVGSGLTATWGGFAEFGLARDHWAMAAAGINRREWDAYRVNQVIPMGIDPIDAPMIITWRETLSYLRRMGFIPGASVLIAGSGGNGLAFAAHAARLQAARVVMLGSPSRQPTAEALGCTEYYDYRQDAPFATGTAAFDFIIDAVGRQGTLDRLLPHLKPSGTIGVYGMDDLEGNSLNPRNARGAIRVAGGAYDEEETHHEVVSAVQRNELRAEPWIGSAVFTLDSMSEAFTAVRKREVVKALVAFR